MDPLTGAATGRRALRVHVVGRVQGVGFRPFVARTADALGLTGWVRNTPDGMVEIHLDGPAAALDRFLDQLRAAPPSASEVRQIEVEEVEAEPARDGPRDGFRIRSSVRDRATATSARVPLVAPDLAACPACQAEFLDPADRRFGYALNACTACGPRFTAMTVLPFDRERTALVAFPLCTACRADYDDPANRRFHAEMTACARCGPRYWLETVDDPAAGADRTRLDDRAVLDATARRLRAGEIVAMKGLGGFHLLCDATSDAAVARLRQRKRRERKPFAVLFADLDEMARHLELSDEIRAAVATAAAPIVLTTRRAGSTLAAGIAPGLSTVGALLAYTPAHRALVRSAGRPLVATSANASDEPMPIDNQAARVELRPVADAFLLHDRPILRPADDSVARLIAGQATPLRIGRGLAPLRLDVPAELPPALAVGGHLKAAVAYARGDAIVLGAHVGDLATAPVRTRYRSVLADLGVLLGIAPEVVVCDRHPDYFSTRVAHELGLPVVAVQHHVAHAAATLAEHGERGPALAITWDGTGLGDDGGIWGGECFRIEPGRADRVAALWPFRLVGGDRAAREPRRSALGVLHAAGPWALPRADGLIEGWFSQSERRLLESALHAPRAATLCTSAGRLFDAWAALLDLSDRAAFEAEPALRLEDQAEPGHHDAFPIAIVDSSDQPERPSGPRWRIDWRPWVDETLRGRDRGVSAARLAARFQNSLAQSCVEIARRVGLETVVLGGGCFQNARLTETLVARLEHDGFRPLIPRRLPAGDGGLAVGQLWAAVLGLAGAKLGALREICGGSDKTPENSRKTSRRNFDARG